ncbi:hypothetical protein GCM10011405_36000 [Rufibacter glacialis]|nr:hypothetical protein GCM10011405_36000 [Rufibacter glacialis]
MYALAEYSHEPMALVGPDNSVLFVNQALCQLVGHTKEYLLQEGKKAVIDSTDPRWALAVQAREEVGFFKGEVTVIHKTGFKIPVEMSTRSFTATDGSSYVSVHVRDLRPEKEVQQILMKQRKDLEKALHDLQLVLDSTADLICTFTPQGYLLQINKACIARLGYAPEEMLGKHFREFLHPDDLAKTVAETDQVYKNNFTLNFKNRYLHKDGSVVHLSWSSSLFEEENKIYAIARDVTTEFAVEEKHRQNEAKMKALLQEGFDMICIIDQVGYYSFVSGSARQIVGYDPEDLLGYNAFDLIHPEDVLRVLKDLERVVAGPAVQTQPFRFKSKEGQWKWMETKGVNCFQNPAINGIIINSRDVTERVEDHFKLERSEKLYRSLFENNPDSIYSLDKEGYFTSVNAATVACSGYTEEQLLQMHFGELLPPGAEEEAVKEFRRALAGESVTSETTVLTATGVKLDLAITKVPVIVNEELLGIHGIAKDITQDKQQQQLLESTANRLNTILGSIRDAFFTLDKNWCFTYLNQEFEEAMQVKKQELYGKDIRKVYAAEEFGSFLAKFTRAITTRYPVHFEEFSQKLNKWLDVSAYPSEEGLTVFIRRIDERKKVEAELKKLSLVASKTVNSVYITDEEARIEWVNEGFTRITGYTIEEVKGLRPGDFLAGPATQPEAVSHIRQKLSYDEPFVQEVQNQNKYGEVYWSKLDVTPIIDEGSGGGKKFIVIETVITEQKKAEEERIKLTEELLRRNRHLEQFTYIVSHNLRSPVANILGLTSLLCSNQNNQENQEGLTMRLRQTAQNLDYIIRDLNEMLSLQAGILDNREKLNLPQLVEQALQVLPTESCDNINVQLNGIEEIGSTRSYVTSIISNLLTNAVKYRSPERPLSLTIKAELDQEKEMLCLSVQDNGLGINLEKEGKNLFGLYKRFHFHVSGRGLGLYLVKTQAEALGGYVEVESKLNEGSTFKVWIKNN